MARVAILLPRDEMLETARQAAEQYHLDLLGVYAVHSSEILEKTQEVISAGADIVIARGYQATLIKKHSSITLVEAQLTSQEIVQLIMKAKSLTTKAHPVIGLVGFENMFHSTAGLSEILDVDLKTWMVELHEEIPGAVEQAKEAGVDVLIGGDVACTVAAELQIPSVFLTSGPESIAEACRVTRHVAYALDIEKRNAVELKALLDYTVSGLIHLDNDGKILYVNHTAEQSLHTTEAEVKGVSIWQVIPTLREHALKGILEDGRESESFQLKIGQSVYWTVVSPIKVEEKNTGLILSLTEEHQLKLYAEEQQRRLKGEGFSAPFTFDTFVPHSARITKLIDEAKHYSNTSSLPVLILGEFGTEKEELAQCIHNAGAFRDSAFLHFNCSGPDPDRIAERLFGRDGLASATQGVLFLNEVSALSDDAQYQLYRMLIGRADSSFGTLRANTVPPRVIAADTHDLGELVQRGEFREDLWYALTVMVLRIPPLRQRPEDVLSWSDYFFRELQRRYGRYIHLTKAAQKRLTDYEWPGNLAQLRNICERIMIDSPRRTVDEIFLDGLLQSSAPFQKDIAGSGSAAASYTNPKAARIAQLLELHHGNRKAVAADLGVSVTTLWRYMKKYQIE